MSGNNEKLEAKWWARSQDRFDGLAQGKKRAQAGSGTAAEALAMNTESLG